MSQRNENQVEPCNDTWCPDRLEADPRSTDPAHAIHQGVIAFEAAISSDARSWRLKSVIHAASIERGTKCVLAAHIRCIVYGFDSAASSHQWASRETGATIRTPCPGHRPTSTGKAVPVKPPRRPNRPRRACDVFVLSRVGKRQQQSPEQSAPSDRLAQVLQ